MTDPSPPRLVLRLLPELHVVAQLPLDVPLPAWSELESTLLGDRAGTDSAPGSLLSLTRVGEELSLVAPQTSIGALREKCRGRSEPRIESGWRVLEVRGPLDFALVGILASLVGPLAGRGISVFTLSTYDTDYLLVQQDSLAEARTALEEAGHRFSGAPGGGFSQGG